MLDRAYELPFGDYAECGVYTGDSGEKIAQRLAPNSTLYLCDTFTGHPFSGEFDDNRHHPKGRYSDVDLEAVKKRFSPYSNVEFVQGEFSKTLPQLDGKMFRLVHCDCDLYESYRTVIKFFVPRMVPGGIIRFDDLSAGCPGAFRAVEEAFGSPIEFYVRPNQDA